MGKGLARIPVQYPGYPYVALAPEGAIRLQDCPAIRTWLDRIKGLSGYFPMEGIDPATR